MTSTPAKPVDHEAAMEFAERTTRLAPPKSHVLQLARAYLAAVAQLAEKELLWHRMFKEAMDRAEAAEARATASDASLAAMGEVMRDAAKSIRRVLDATPDAYRHGQAELIAAAQWLSAGPGEDGNG